jgi:hypothetical protein
MKTFHTPRPTATRAPSVRCSSGWSEGRKPYSYKYLSVCRGLAWPLLLGCRVVAAACGADGWGRAALLEFSSALSPAGSYAWLAFASLSLSKSGTLGPDDPHVARSRIGEDALRDFVSGRASCSKGSLEAIGRRSNLVQPALESLANPNVIVGIHDDGADVFE